KEMIFPGAAPIGQFLLTWSVAIQVVQKITQAVIAERDTPLFGAFALDQDECMLAIKIPCAQSTQLGETNTRIVEDPQDGAIPGGGTIGKGTDLSWRGTGQQKLLKLLRLDGADERPANLGKDHAVEGVASNDLAVHQPVEEGTRRTCVGLDG